MLSLLSTINLHILAGAQVNCANGSVCDTGLPTVKASSTNLQHGAEVVIGVVAVISVVMVVVGGLRFILAQGDSQGVSKARQTVLYALIGLAIAVSAEAIVAFVLNRL